MLYVPSPKKRDSWLWSFTVKWTECGLPSLYLFGLVLGRVLALTS
jgi:hypothetical protein